MGAVVSLVYICHPMILAGRMLCFKRFINLMVNRSRPVWFRVIGVMLLMGMGEVWATPVIHDSIPKSLLDDTLYINPVVVTGQSEGVRSSQSVVRFRVVSAQTIRQMAAVNLADVLSRQPNIRLSNDNMLGSSMTLQNLSGQQVKFLVNGMPITGRENGNINLDQINLEHVERIELVEGPMSVIYGTDALGGVVNVITKKNIVSHTQGGGYGYVESVGHYNGGAHITQPLGEHAVLTSGLSRNFFDGIPHPQIDRVHLWKPREQWFGFAGYHRKTSTATWNFRTDFLSETIQSKGPITITPLYAQAFDDYFLTRRGIHSMNVIFDIAPKWRMDMINGVSHYKRQKRVVIKDMLDLLETPIDNPDENTDNLFVNAMARAVISHKASTNATFFGGYDVNYDIAIADRVAGNDVRMIDAAVFSMLDWSVYPALRIRPGIRAAYNSVYSAPITPSVHVMWTLHKKWQMRSSYGRGFRAPTLKEQQLYFVDINHNVQGNPHLKPEYSHNVQAGIDFKNYHPSGLAYAFGLNMYYNDVRNMIGLYLQHQQQYTYENYGLFRGGGALVELKTYYKKFSVEAALGYLVVQNRFSDQVGNAYYFSPDITASASYYWEKPKVNMSVFLKHNGKFVNYIRNESGGISEFYTEGMTFLDANCSKVFGHINNAHPVTVQLGVKNILDIRNITNINPFNSFHSAGSTMNLSPGRTFFCKLSIQFQHP